MLLERIRRWARAQSDRPALIEGDRVTSFAEFAGRIEAVRSHLEAQRLQAGRFAVVLTTGGARQWFVVIALRALGLHTVCVPSLDLAAQLKLGNVAYIVVGTGERLAEIPPRLAAARVIAVPLPVFDQVSTPSPLASAQTGPPAGGYLLYTSGTTGTYKKLFYEPAKEEKALDWMRECFLFDRTSVFHAVDYPPWAAIGSRTVSSVWFAGGCVVLSGSPGRFEGFFRHQPTRAILVPAMLARLLQTPQTYKIPSPFTLGVTGGFLPLALAQEAVRKLTPSLNVIYGSSELTALMYSRFRTLEDLHWLAPYGDNVIEVVDSEQKDAIGAEGELRIRLRDFDPRGYFDDAEASHRFFRDGYFYPGDLAFKREDGRIRVLGRVEDVLNLQGWKVAVAPLEERIQRALHVDAVCAFSELDDEGKDRVVIAVEADRRLPDQDLRASIHDMRGFEDVRWVFLKSFPRTTAGMNKVDRRTLRTLLRR